MPARTARAKAPQYYPDCQNDDRPNHWLSRRVHAAPLVLNRCPAWTRRLSGDVRKRYPHDLAGVHDIERVESLFDGTHHLQRRPVLGGHEVQLADADAVLAGAGAVHVEG